MTRTRTAESASLPIALTYTRVSSEEQAREGVSLDAQLSECRRYAAQHGWVLGPEFQDVLSGKRDDRPAYQALLAEARRLRAAGQLVSVVVFRLDRLGRRILERVRCREELKGLGVPVHSVREGGEVGDLVANILASVAEEESRALGERVAASIQHIGERGWYCPGRTPWGYRLRPATPDERAQGAPISVLEPDPVTSPWVQEAFFRAAGGQTIRAVHRWATALPSEARGGRVLTYRAVRQILGSPVYIGRVPSGDDDVLSRLCGRWQPLVEEQTWLRVHERIASHQHVPRQASQYYMVTGLLRCPNCGGRMHGKGRAGHSRSYRCTSHTSGANAATRTCFTSVLADQVEQAVLAEVLPLVEAAASTLPELRGRWSGHGPRCGNRLPCRTHCTSASGFG
jgi:site-specific DNA recombinase